MHFTPLSVLDFILFSEFGWLLYPVYSALLKLRGSRRLASVLFRDFFN